MRTLNVSWPSTPEQRAERSASAERARERVPSNLGPRKCSATNGPDCCGTSAWRAAIMRVEVWVRQSDRSDEVVQPDVVVFDSQRGMIAGEFLLDNCSVERAAVCFVGEHDDTVAA